MRTSILSVLAFALVTGLSSVAQAQQENRQATFGNVIAALNNINVQIENLNALNDLTVQDVQVVNVENLVNDNNIKALNNAINRNRVNILNLRNVLNNNQIIQDVLNDSNVVISDVIAIDVLSGDVRVFIFEPNTVQEEE